MYVMVGISDTHVVCRYQMRLLNSLFAYLYRLANNKKGKYQEFCMGYSDGTWHAGSSGLHLHICSDKLISKMQISKVLYWLP